MFKKNCKDLLNISQSDIILMQYNSVCYSPKLLKHTVSFLYITLHNIFINHKFWDVLGKKTKATNLLSLQMPNAFLPSHSSLGGGGEKRKQALRASIIANMNKRIFNKVGIIHHFYKHTTVSDSQLTLNYGAK